MYFSFLFLYSKEKNRNKNKTFFNKICCIVKINAAKQDFYFWCAQLTMNKKSTTHGLSSSHEMQRILIEMVETKQKTHTHQMPREKGNTGKG